MERSAAAAAASKRRRLAIVLVLMAAAGIVLSTVGYVVVTIPYANGYVPQTPQSVSAGVAFQATITVLDQFGHVFAGYRGSVSFDSNDSAASLPGVYTFNASDAGVHTFGNLVFRTLGLRALRVTSTQNSALAAQKSIRVLSPSPNQAPVITGLSVDRETAEIGQSLAFTAQAMDPDGDPLSYAWDFGDGHGATGESQVHAYSLPGRYIVAMNVSDGRGGLATNDLRLIFLTIFARSVPPPSSSSLGPPVATLVANRSLIRTGDAVAFDGNASWTYVWNAPAFPGGPWTVSVLTAGSGGPSLFPGLRYRWGDGTPDSVGSPTSVGQQTHSFSAAGSYPVVLNVTRSYNGTQAYAEAGYTVRVTTALPVDQVKNPDVLFIASDAEPDSLDPASARESAGREILQNVYETLVRFPEGSSDATTLVPWLATDVPSQSNGLISPDGRNYTFNLRQNVTFHDGSHMTAAEVAYSIRRVLAIHNPQGPSQILEQVLTNNVSRFVGRACGSTGTKQCTVGDWVNATFTSRADVPANIIYVVGPQTVWDTEPIDISLAWAVSNSTVGMGGPYQVTFHLTRAFPAFLQVLQSIASSIVSKYYVEAHGGVQWGVRNGWMMQHTSGTGPFVLQVWQPYQRISLSRVAYYWRIAPALSEVHLLDVEDDTARQLMLLAGDVDVGAIGWNHQSDVMNADGTPKYPTLRIAKDQPTFDVSILGYNQAVNVSATPDPWTLPADFFTNVHIRKAFSYSFDYNAFIQNVIYGGGIRLRGPIPQGLLGYNASMPLFSLDVAKAAAELKLAPNPNVAGKTYFDTGFSLTLYYNAGNLARESAALLFKQGLEAISALAGAGRILVAVRALDSSVYLSTLGHHGLPIVLLDWASDYPDPDGYVTPILHSGSTFPNWLGYRNSTMDALIDAAARELNSTKRAKMYEDLFADAVVYDVPYLWIDQATNFHVERSWVHGYYFNPILYGLDYSPMAKG